MPSAGLRGCGTGTLGSGQPRGGARRCCERCGLLRHATSPVGAGKGASILGARRRSPSFPCPPALRGDAKGLHKPSRREPARLRPNPCVLQGQVALQQPQNAWGQSCASCSLPDRRRRVETVVLSTKTCLCSKKKKEGRGAFPRDVTCEFAVQVPAGGSPECAAFLPA